MEEVLFQITKDQLETGMRGFPVGYCTTSFVDPIKGLFYRGKPIADLCTWEAERVIYLLKHGKEGTSQDITRFSEELKKRGNCSQAVIKYIEKLPRQGHPMKLFAATLLLLGIVEGQNDYKEDCLNVIAKIPHLVATLINYHAGCDETPVPKEKLGYVENFVHMLQLPEIDKQHLVEIFRLFAIMHFDHGGGNLSTFVGKSVASSHADMFSSLSSAISALSGPLHGRANQDALAFVKSVIEELGEDPLPSQVEALIRKHLEKNEVIYGFGHAVLRAEDARAAIFYDYAEKHFKDNPLIKIALILRTEATKVLKENTKISDPFPNVDAISGSLLSAAGFNYPEYFPVLFGLARVVGIALQIVYERCYAREGKGTPIIRPRYLYKPDVKTE